MLSSTKPAVQGRLQLNDINTSNDLSSLLELMIDNFRCNRMYWELRHGVEARTLKRSGDHYLITVYDTRSHCASFYGFCTVKPQEFVRSTFRNLIIQASDAGQQNNVRLTLQRIWDRAYVLDGKFPKNNLSDLQWSESHTGLIQFPYHPDLTSMIREFDFITYDKFSG